MTANQAVADGDDKEGAVNDRFDPKFRDLKRRVIEETLPSALVARAVQGIIEGDFVVGGLLKYIGFVKLKAVKRFDIAANFKKGKVVGGRRIDWIGDNFHEHFDDLVEVDVPERTVYIWELLKDSLDEPIIKLLGGADESETLTSLAHTFQMMELGEKSRGRLDGYANFGYKNSPKDGTLWVPFWLVFGGGFGVEAYSSSDPREWSVGFRVSGG